MNKPKLVTDAEGTEWLVHYNPDGSELGRQNATLLRASYDKWYERNKERVERAIQAMKNTPKEVEQMLDWMNRQKPV